MPVLAEKNASLLIYSSDEENLLLFPTVWLHELFNTLKTTIIHLITRDGDQGKD